MRLLVQSLGKKIRKENESRLKTLVKIPIEEKGSNVFRAKKSISFMKRNKNGLSWKILTRRTNLHPPCFSSLFLLDRCLCLPLRSISSVSFFLPWAIGCFVVVDVWEAVEP